MHYHCEIIMPPTDDVPKAVAEIMAPFNENSDDEYVRRRSFWDWYVIGGRWAGAKAEAALDPVALEAFQAWLVSERVMVSALQFGKQELADAETVRKVDAKWREMFPGAGDACTLFAHASDRHSERLPGDIMRLGEVSERVTASRVIIAVPGLDGAGLLAVRMVQREFWNGVTFVESSWDGRVASAVSDYERECTATPAMGPDWLVVTVDYHV